MGQQAHHARFDGQHAGKHHGADVERGRHSATIRRRDGSAPRVRRETERSVQRPLSPRRLPFARTPYTLARTVLTEETHMTGDAKGEYPGLSHRNTASLAAWLAKRPAEAPLEPE